MTTDVRQTDHHTFYIHRHPMHHSCCEASAAPGQHALPSWTTHCLEAVIRLHHHLCLHSLDRRSRRRPTLQALRVHRHQNQTRLRACRRSTAILTTPTLSMHPFRCAPTKSSRLTCVPKSAKTPFLKYMMSAATRLVETMMGAGLRVGHRSSISLQPRHRRTSYGLIVMQGRRAMRTFWVRCLGRARCRRRLLDRLHHRRSLRVHDRRSRLRHHRRQNRNRLVLKRSVARSQLESATTAQSHYAQVRHSLWICALRPAKTRS